MDELDRLKKDWQKEQHYPHINSAQIKKMLHKNSSSIVQWVFVISLLELIVGALLTLVWSIEEQPGRMPIFYWIDRICSYILYPVILYFIAQFFIDFRKIKTNTNTKVLLEQILRARKHVDQYILFNISYISILFITISVEETLGRIDNNFMETSNMIKFVILTMVFALVGFLLFLLIKLYYKLLYHRLMRKLTQNYEELRTLAEEK